MCTILCMISKGRHDHHSNCTGHIGLISRVPIMSNDDFLISIYPNILGGVSNKNF